MEKVKTAKGGVSVNSAERVSTALEQMKAGGVPLSEQAWQVALLCVGWAYVFGARGQYCTPANRRARDYEKYPTIKTKCKNFDGAVGCGGCKWYPGGKYTRTFDCRGFTYWVLKQVYGWELMGAGATSQWNNEANWKAQGEISDGIPQGVIVCVFYYKKENGKRTKTLEHTGLYYNGETVECSNGVQHSTTLNTKWDVWGVPACVDVDTPTPTPETKPTLRRGDSGKWVTLAQTQLIQQGYDCGSTGADGKFGKNTEAAVKRFQLDHGLTVDGVIGEKTWNALCGAEPAIQYTVTIPGLTATQADALILQYPGSTKIEERG